MKILLVEDEKISRVTLNDTLQKKGNTVIACETGRIGLEAFDKEDFDVVLTDLRLPSMSGIDILKYVKQKKPNIFVIVMTAFGTIETAVHALKLGAYEYLTKPFSYDELFIILDKIRDYKNIVNENLKLKTALSFPKQIIGNSPAIKKIMDTIETVAPTDFSILIIGETGTGKEIIADAIHNQSARKDNALIKINCAALSETLLESELFGHEKGAFTGAVKMKKGRFELANSGTIFLDEVDDIPLSMQVKLLRVLQEKEIERVGGGSTITVDVRVIAASKTNLQDKVNLGKFREDLYYRLNVVPIGVPPLRERLEDLPHLVKYFLQKHDIANKIDSFSSQCIEEMANYNWPGNIRELENIIQRMIAFSRDKTISIDDLPSHIKPSDINKDIFNYSLLNNQSVSFENLFEEFEKKLLNWSMDQAKQNKSKAADMLQLSRSTFRSKLAKYGIDN